jgi:hypothetical protein
MNMTSEQAAQYVNVDYIIDSHAIDAWYVNEVRECNTTRYEALVMSGLKGINLERAYNKLLADAEQECTRLNGALNDKVAALRKEFNIPPPAVLRRRVRKA